MGKHVLTPSMKIAIIPPMAAGIGNTCWGSNWLTLPQEVQQLFGIQMPELLNKSEDRYAEEKKRSSEAGTHRR